MILSQYFNTQNDQRDWFMLEKSYDLISEIKTEDFGKSFQDNSKVKWILSSSFPLRSYNFCLIHFIHNILFLILYLRYGNKMEHPVY